MRTIVVGLCLMAQGALFFGGCGSDDPQGGQPSGDGDGSTGDGDGDKGMGGNGSDVCHSDKECSDGTFCNGKERCLPDNDDADRFGCVRARHPACGDNSCSESGETCGCGDPDNDGDGHDSVDCGGDDCDDNDANRFPGNAELCDAEDHDEDCDPTTFGLRDQDGDDDPDAQCCNEDDDSGKRYCGSDCDDSRAVKHSFNTETCDDIDNDCDGVIDELPDSDEPDGLKQIFTIDSDGDGYGLDAKDAKTIKACTAPKGYALTATDCDDDEPEINPAAFDSCEDDIDNNCNGKKNDPMGGCDCEGNTTRACALGGWVGKCATYQQQCNNGKWDDCPLLKFAEPEVCAGNDVDEDCDGFVDEIDLTPTMDQVSDSLKKTYYRDRDGDGYPNLSTTAEFCPDLQPSGWVDDENPEDCLDVALSEDSKANEIHPGADEICNGRDDDCTAGIDNGPFADEPSIEDTTFMCVSGKWEVNECPDSTLHCDSNINNGCETDGTSIETCGDCDTSCLFSCGVKGSEIQCIEVVTLSLGEEHGCLVDEAKKAACWGRGDAGRLGYGQTESKHRPEPVTNLSDVRTIDVGVAHSCATTGSNGDLYCWGSNGSGRLGINSATPATSATPLMVDSDIAAFALGSEHSCSVDTGGVLRCWGEGSDGRLGTTSDSDALAPTIATYYEYNGGAAVQDAVQVTAGVLHTCILNEDDLVFCAGANNQGQLGTTATDADDYGAYFHQVDTLSEASAIAAGYFHTCAIQSGEVWCWGNNSSNELQAGGDKIYSAPHKIPGISGATAISLGGAHSCALSGGEVYCWGQDLYGQLGNAEPILSKVTSLASGANHVCAQQGELGEVKCWGRNNHGQLGSGETNTGANPDPILLTRP